jgi:hypothetical protein
MSFYMSETTLVMVYDIHTQLNTQLNAVVSIQSLSLYFQLEYDIIETLIYIAFYVMPLKLITRLNFTYNELS